MATDWTSVTWVTQYWAPLLIAFVVGLFFGWLILGMSLAP